MTAMLHNSRNIKEAKTKQQEVVVITRWEDFNNSVEFGPLCCSMVEGQIWGGKLRRKVICNLLANSLKTVADFSPKNLTF